MKLQKIGEIYLQFHNDDYRTWGGRKAPRAAVSGVWLRTESNLSAQAWLARLKFTDGTIKNLLARLGYNNYSSPWNERYAREITYTKGKSYKLNVPPRQLILTTNPECLFMLTRQGLYRHDNGHSKFLEGWVAGTHKEDFIKILEKHIPSNV